MDIKLCARIIERNFPQIHINNIVPLFGGWGSDVFEVNGELIFKFPKRPETESLLQKEMNLLPELAKVLSVQVPTFEFVGRYAAKMLVGYRKISGLPLALCNYDLENLCEQLAKVITEIHLFSVDKAMELKVPKISWRREHTEFYDRMKNNVFPLMDKALREKAVSIWNGFLDNQDNFQFEPVFVHRDLSGDAHILCDPEKLEITGIIDWEDAAIGDPAIDFTGIYWDCGEEFTKRILAKYAGKVDKTFWDRVLFYYNIGPFHEISWGQLINDHTHINNGLKDLTERLHGYNM